MKVTFSFLLLWGLILLGSCDNVKNSEVPVITFEAPFPKRNIKLTNILGERLTIKSGNDTFIYNISSASNSNTVTNPQTGDTLFSGRVCRYRGLCYFSQQLSDTSYSIYAVRIADNLIYGFDAYNAQLWGIYAAIKSGAYPHLIRYTNSDSTVIILRTDKKYIGKLFNSIVADIIPDTILTEKEIDLNPENNEEEITAIDPVEFELLSKVYPNPAKDFIHIELQRAGHVQFELAELNGKIMLQGSLSQRLNQVNISGLDKGVYLLTLVGVSENFKESVKVIKAE